ncbi:MAG: co-chaperone DjlA [Desulfobacteraceae bacterium]|nr:co-chaperone DjlA [Desulfobacteraceae bacterium]MCF8093798.1 co-chaperone DjlA [Desulfobacteraceae bacterium]
MSWLGKMVGGTIGFALGGPLGAIAGAALGHLMDADKGEQQRVLPGAGQMAEQDKAQLTFFVAAFSMLAKLARVDGQVTDEEIGSIRRFMNEDLRLNAESRQMGEKIFNTALKAPQTFEEFASQFYQQFHNRPELLELMIDILLRVSVADGRMDKSEEALIESAVRTFGLPDADYQSMKSRYVSNTEKYYAVLGCSPSDDNATIKKRYRKLVRDYHPDTIASKGLPEEFVNFANDKFREIQEAYEAIQKERGMT